MIMLGRYSAMTNKHMQLVLQSPMKKTNNNDNKKKKY